MKRKTKVKHTYRDFTPEEDAMFEQARQEDDAELEELKAEARDDFARDAKLRDVLAALKRAREAKGVSLAQLDKQTGIGKGNLSRLENHPQANPTLETLLRYAQAIGVELHIAVVDQVASKPKVRGRAA